MKRQTRAKCLHCKELYSPDYRNRGRQCFCSQPECRKASKAHSQVQWLSKPENKSHFCGPEHVRRVQRWRETHPGYWRTQNSAGPTLPEPLQDPCLAQSVENEPVVARAVYCLPAALQDLCLMQPAVLVGLISMITDSALQDDIARNVRGFLVRGQDILGIKPKAVTSLAHENQTHPLSPTAAARAAAV